MRTTNPRCQYKRKSCDREGTIRVWRQGMPCNPYYYCARHASVMMRREEEEAMLVTSCPYCKTKFGVR